MEDTRQEIIEIIKNKLFSEGKSFEDIDNETFEEMYKEVKKEIESNLRTQQTISQIQDRRISEQLYDSFQQVARKRITSKSDKQNFRDIKTKMENNEGFVRKK